MSTRTKYFKQTAPYMVFLPWTKHAQVLSIAGLAYMGIGITYITSTPSPSREAALRLALHWFPIQGWGAIFCAVGLLTLISSRWPPVTKRWGYVLLTGISAGWSATYAAGVIFDGSPPQNLSGFFLWGNFAFLWWIISGLTEHTKPEKEADGLH